MTPVRYEAALFRRPALDRALRSFTFLRHGRTADNHAGIMQGHRDVPLDDVGREQAEDAAEILYAAGAVAQVVSSDLTRARATAEALARRCRLEVVVDADLRERCFGPLEGTPSRADLWNAPLEGVECAFAFARRIERALRRHAGGDHVVLVAHGGVLRVAGWMLGLDLDPSHLRNAVPLSITPGQGGWEARRLERRAAASDPGRGAFGTGERDETPSEIDRMHLQGGKAP